MVMSVFEFERVLECIVSIALSALRLSSSVILFLETHEEVLFRKTLVSFTER